MKTNNSCYIHSCALLLLGLLAGQLAMAAQTPVPLTKVSIPVSTTKDKAGLVYAKMALPKRVFAYITQPSKQVDAKIAKQLDDLLADDTIQATFCVLEKDAINRTARMNELQDRGFSFCEDHYDVFKHTSIPGCVLKIANEFALESGAFASNIGRLWYGDYVRTQCAQKNWSITVPEKRIHFMAKQCRCASLYAIIVAREHDLSGMKLLYELSPKHRADVHKKLKSLRYPDSIDANVFGKEGSQNYLLIDTETLDKVDFDECYPLTEPDDYFRAFGSCSSSLYKSPHEPKKEYKEKD